MQLSPTTAQTPRKWVLRVAAGTAVPSAYRQQQQLGLQPAPASQGLPAALPPLCRAPLSRAALAAPPHPARAANGRRAPAPLLLWPGGRRQPIRRRQDIFVAVATGAADQWRGSREAARGRRSGGKSAWPAEPGAPAAASRGRARRAAGPRAAGGRVPRWVPGGLLSSPHASRGSPTAPLLKEIQVNVSAALPSTASNAKPPTTRRWHCAARKSHQKKEGSRVSTRPSVPRAPGARVLIHK